MRWTRPDEAATGRDEVEFELAGSQVDMVKGVYTVTRGATVVQGPFPPNTDHRPVQGGDVVTYRIDVTNTGTSGAGSDVPVRAVVVKDVLPTGVTCSAVSNISDSPYGSCTGSTIQWNLPITDIILADQTRAPLTYDVTVPPQASVNTTYTNTATVLEYQSRTNSGWVTNEPVDVTDVSDVYTANVTIAKTGVTSLNLPNNNLPNQFTVGEDITYNVDIKVPPGTTANAGVMSDTLPANLQYVSSSAQYAASGLVPDLSLDAARGHDAGRDGAAHREADAAHAVHQHQFDRIGAVPHHHHRARARLHLHARRVDHEHRPLPGHDVQPHGVLRGEGRHPQSGDRQVEQRPQPGRSAVRPSRTR